MKFNEQGPPFLLMWDVIIITIIKTNILPQNQFLIMPLIWSWLILMRDQHLKFPVFIKIIGKTKTIFRKSEIFTQIHLFDKISNVF